MRTALTVLLLSVVAVAQGAGGKFGAGGLTGAGGGTNAGLPFTATPIQKQKNASCATAACAVTVTGTTLHNVGVLYSIVNFNGTGFTTGVGFTGASDNASGTGWQHCPNSYVTEDSSSPDYDAVDCWINLDLPSGATTVTATWTLTGLTSPTIKHSAFFREYQPSRTPVYLDSGNGFAGLAACTACLGPLGKITGNGSMIVVAGFMANTITSINSPFTNFETDSAGNNIKGAVADLQQTGYTTPTWNQSSGVRNYLSFVSFSGNPTPTATGNVWVDMSQCTVGSAPTVLCMGNSTFSGWSMSQDVSNIGSLMTVCTSGPSSKLPFPVNVNGFTYNGSGPNNMCGTTTAPGTGIKQYNVGTSAGGSSMTIGFTTQSSCVASGDCGATFRISSNVDFAVIHMSPAGDGKMCLETNAPGGCSINGADSGTYTINTPYRVNIQMNNGPAAAAGTMTFANGSAVITFTNTYAAGQPVQFTTAGTLPTNFAINTVYYVSATGLSGSQFEVATTPGGTPIIAGSAGSGVHSVWTLAVDRMTVCADGIGGAVLSTHTSVSLNSASPINTISIGVNGQEPTTAGYNYYFRNIVANGTYSTARCF